MDNSNNKMTQEEKEMLLKETQKYTEKLDALNELHQEFIDEQNNTDKTKEDSVEIKYDIEKERKNIVKEKKINRKLGYHRRYLSSNIKLSNIVLLLLFIFLAIFVFFKFSLQKSSPPLEQKIAHILPISLSISPGGI